MTYCIGVMLDKGIIFASDSRTNAGMDNIAKFCKMTVFERAGDRVIVLLSSGNLAGTQAVIGVLNQRCMDGDSVPNLWNARTMFDVAMLVADAMRDIERRDGPYLEESEIRFNASFIVGGQRRASTPPSSRPARPSTASRSSTVSSRRRHRWPMPPSACWCLLTSPCAATCRWACPST